MIQPVNTLELDSKMAVGELEEIVLAAINSYPRPIVTTLDIAKKLYDKRHMTTQDVRYRQVLRAMQNLQRKQKIGSYNHSQRSPRMWWSKDRLK